MNDSNPTLRKAKKLLKKIAKKLGNKNLRCVAQISTDTEHDDNYVTYTGMIASPKEGVEPIIFAAFSKKEFIEKIQNFLDNKSDVKDLEIAYLEGQKISAQQTIDYADEQIEAIKNPKHAEEESSEEAEEAEEPTKE